MADASMRAVVITSFGDPDVLRVREVPRPIPGPCEIRVRVRASGINRADVLQRLGRYPAPPGSPTDIPGLEFAGRVEALGPGVGRFAVGDAVMGIVGGGGYAEYVTVHERAVARVPGGVGEVDAGAIPEVFMTAFDAVLLQERLAAGETLLVHAVGSGVGTAALQLAKAAGATVVGTARTASKLDRAGELGLDHGVVGGEGWPERVLKITGRRGVDVILDLVGGPYLAGNQQVVAVGGRHIVVGVPGGPVAEIDLRVMMGRRASLRGTVLRARPLEEKISLARAFQARVVPLFESGAVRPVVDRVFRPADAGEAHRYMEENRNFGKILLDWGD